MAAGVDLSAEVPWASSFSGLLAPKMNYELLRPVFLSAVGLSRRDFPSLRSPGPLFGYAPPMGGPRFPSFFQQGLSCPGWLVPRPAGAEQRPSAPCHVVFVKHCSCCRGLTKVTCVFISDVCRLSAVLNECVVSVGCVCRKTLHLVPLCLAPHSLGRVSFSLHQSRAPLLMFWRGDAWGLSH